MADKCPMRIVRSTRDGYPDTFGKCVQEECAWWNASKGKCAIAAIVGSLDCPPPTMLDFGATAGSPEASTKEVPQGPDSAGETA